MTDKELDIIYDFVDLQMRLGRFELLTAMMEKLCGVIYDEPLKLDEILAWLTATLPAKDKIGFRDRFVTWSKERWAIDAEDGIFSGLE